MLSRCGDEIHGAVQEGCCCCCRRRRSAPAECEQRMGTTNIQQNQGGKILNTGCGNRIFVGTTVAFTSVKQLLTTCYLSFLIVEKSNLIRVHIIAFRGKHAEALFEKVTHYIAMYL